MDTLDRNRLKSLVDVLTSAVEMGFESLSSPVEFLLEAAIDVCLLLWKSFNEGRLSQKSNPSLKFLDVSDDLGNPKQITLHKKRKIWFDPKIAEIFKQIAAFCVLTKRSSNEAISFMENSFRTKSKPPEVEIPLDAQKIQKKSQDLSNKRKMIGFYRRLRKKRFKDKK